jgi:hypothetical protein
MDVVLATSPDHEQSTFHLAALADIL